MKVVVQHPESLTDKSQEYPDVIAIMRDCRVPYFSWGGG
jgi:hypothetical protein